MAVLLAVGLAACGDDSTNPPATPPAPTGLTATPSSDGTSIEVAWNAVTGATGYILERAEGAPPGTFTQLGDTLAATDRMAISRSEFAYSYYPTAAQGLPPYNLRPDLLWFTLTEHSNQGLGRTLKLYGGKPMRLVDYDCGKGQLHEGQNAVYGPCVVRWRDADGDTVAVRLFNQVLERGGRFKFLSYGNRLD